MYQASSEDNTPGSVEDMPLEIKKELIPYVEMNCSESLNIKLFGDDDITVLMVSQRKEVDVNLCIDTRRGRRFHNNNSNVIAVDSSNLLSNISPSASVSTVCETV